jgi:hypothetical protein
MVALDWRAMKFFQKRMLLVCPLVIAYGLYLPEAVAPMSAILVCFFSLGPFTVEEKGDLNFLYLTLPIERKSIVAGRFALAALMALCGMALGVLIMFTVGRIALLDSPVPLYQYPLLLAGSYFLYAFVNVFVFPNLFRLGYQKGKLWTVLPIIFVLFIPVALMQSALMNDGFDDMIEYLKSHVLLVSGALAAAATALLALSYALSVRIYTKRDF